MSLMSGYRSAGLALCSSPLRRPSVREGRSPPLPALSYCSLSFSFQHYLARNFYNLRFLALFVAFAINFILLFYKVIFHLGAIC